MKTRPVGAVYAWDPDTEESQTGGEVRLSLKCFNERNGFAATTRDIDPGFVRQARAEL